jgi:L-histidine Nalpha-methyltransferase
VRINRELGADFDLDGFRHEARFDAEKRRVEMHLVSLRAQRVHLLSRTIDFAAGESIHTENSYKHGPSRIEALAWHAGWAPRQRWMDSQSRFAVHVFENRIAGAVAR